MYVRKQVLVADEAWQEAAAAAGRREMSLMAWVREAIREKLERGT